MKLEKGRIYYTVAKSVFIFFVMTSGVKAKRSIMLFIKYLFYLNTINSYSVFELKIEI